VSLILHQTALDAVDRLGFLAAVLVWVKVRGLAAVLVRVRGLGLAIVL
jgi:hypothetical protein